jgi:hypothetical protein
VIELIFTYSVITSTKDESEMDVQVFSGLIAASRV